MISVRDMLKDCIVGSLLLAFTASEADALPITWTLSDVTIAGSSVTGSFVFDADTVTYNNISIFTSGGSILPSTSYFRVAPCSSCTRSDFLGVVDSSAVDLTGANFLGLELAANLTDGGGVIPLAAAAELGTCAISNCSLFNDYPNNPTDGIAFATGDVTAVPEPSSLTLLGMGALLLGLFRKLGLYPDPHHPRSVISSL